MICQSCGHDNPGTLTRCSSCGQITSRRMRSVSTSRLIEFPKQPNREAGRDTPKPVVPAWRAEVAERVRAARAKRSSDLGGITAPSSAGVRDLSAAELPANETTVQQSVSLPRSDNPLVEAALNRVRRAADNSAASTKAPVARSSRTYATTAVAADRDATARALQPEPVYVAERTTRPLPERAKPAAKPVVALAEPAVSNPKPKRIIPSPDYSDDLPPLEESSIGTSEKPIIGEHSLAEPIDEIEPRDYLADEIRRVDRALNQGKRRSDAASILAQLTANVVDLIVVAISSLPFLALIQLNHGAYFEQNTRIAGVAIALVLSFFYLCLTHCVGGRTFGMMLTGTRIVSIGSDQPPSLSRALRRTVGYYFAIAPAGLGFVWAALSTSGRGLHDIIGGTAVVTDR